MIIGAWNFIQTETFSTWLAAQTKERIFKHTGIEMSFKEISIGFFPLATRLHDISLNRKIDEIEGKVELRANELAIVFSLFDLFRSKVTIKRIAMQDGSLGIDSPMIDELFASEDDTPFPWEKVQIAENYRLIEQLIHQNLPVDIFGLRLDRFSIQLSSHKFWAEKLYFGLQKELSLEAIIEDLHLGKEKLDRIVLVATCRDDRVNIKKFMLNRQLEKLEFKGKIVDAKPNASVQGTLMYEGGAHQLFEQLGKYDRELSSIDAYWQVKAELLGQINDPDLIAVISASDFKSVYGQFDQLQGRITKEGERYTLTTMQLLKDTGKAALIEPLILWEKNQAKILDSDFNVQLDGFHTNDALYYIRDTISPLKSSISGTLNVKIKKEGQYFSLKKGATAENFQLLFSESDGAVLKNNRLVLQQADFFLDNQQNLSLDLLLSFGKSTISASGEIRQDSILVEAQSQNFDFKQFGPISGVEIEGEGAVDFRVEGLFEDVKFYFDLDLEKSKVVNLDLGKIDGRLRLDLKDLTLSLNQVSGIKGSSKFDATGTIRFEADQRYHFDINFPQGMYRDMLAMYQYYLPMEYMPKGIAFSYQGKYQVYGTLKDSLPSIKGNIAARNLTWFNESVDRLDANFSFINGVIDVTEFYAQKRIATLAGKLVFDIKSEYLEYNAKLNNLRLQDIAMYRVFNFGYDGILEGSFKGDGKSDELITQSKLKVVRGNIFNQATADSHLVAYSDRKNLFVNGSILGSIFTFDSYLNFDLNNQHKLSYVNAALNTSNVKILTGFISDHNSQDNSITGRISANLESSFNFLGPESVNLLFEINEFAFKRDNIRMVLSPMKKNILIKSGEIRHWDLLLKGKNAVIQSFGSGNLARDYTLSSKINIDASALEMIFPRLQKSSGSLNFDWSMGATKDKQSLSVLRGEGENVMLKIAGIPDSLDNLNYMFQLAGNRFDLLNFKGRFGDGQIQAKGRVDIKFPYPDVDFMADVDQARIHFFKNSSIVVSGVGRIRGNSPPYDIKSDLSILYGELLDEFSEYQVQGNEVVDSKYIPKPIEVGFINFFNYDVGVRTLSPLLIRNQMADVQVMGAGHVGGNFHSPNFVGDISAVQGKSRFMFKGHEFSLTEGKLSLGQDLIDIAPSVKMTAVSKIQNYDVKVDLAGKVNNFDLKLSSEPALSQQDILSLLTLGVTSDIANSLDDTGRKSITSLSLGSLIVDQFMLNRGINSSSGIKLSVLPEFGESSGSLLHGRTSGTASSTKMKSATKVKLQTRVAKNVDLSFASTLGGTMNQKQEMQVNYDLGNNMTIKGIYEVEDPETGTSESGTSLGIDFNYRKTFQ